MYNPLRPPDQPPPSPGNRALRIRWFSRAACLLLVGGTLISTCVAGEQPEQEGNTPRRAAAAELDPLVKAALEATYLKPQEAAALRLKHGQPTSDDLAAPAQRAVHALQRGAYSDPSLTSLNADPLDRAEAALMRGDFDAVTAELGALESARALRLRAQYALARGDNPSAILASRTAAARLAEGAYAANADDTVDAVVATAILTRLTDTRGAGGADHQAMMSMLAKARENDPLSWRVPLTEAQLLLEKDNYSEARAAAAKALAHNPAAASVYALLGHMAVNTFNTDGATSAAQTLDRLASMMNLEAEAAPARASLHAAHVRARAALRQSDPLGASLALEDARSVYPKSPLVAQLSAAVAAASFDEPALQKALTEYAFRFGANAEALALVGMTCSDQRQYEQAVTHLRAAIELAPHWPEPRVTLGLVLVQAGRDEEALATLEEATSLDPFNVRAANSLKLVREIGSYQRIETPHFIVRAKPGIDALLAQDVAAVMEENHTRVTAALRFSPAKKTFIDLMPDHQWFAVRIAGMPRIHTIAASTGPVIAMEAPRQGRNHTGLYDWPRVMRHEYAHSVGLAKTNNRLPHWFTEAQAQVLEEAPRDFNTAGLLAKAYEADTLFDFSEINLAFTRPKKPTDRAQAYAQGQWMYEYMLHRFGPDAPLKLMDLFAVGVREEEAVQRIFVISRDQFLSDFKAWAHQQLVEWGMLPREGAPTLKSMIDTLPKAEGSDDPPQPTHEQLAQWAREHPTDPDTLNAYLVSAINAADGEVTPELVPTLLEYAKVRPVDPFPHKQLARYLLARQKPSEAAIHLEWLDARETTSPVYATQLAGIYAQTSPPDWINASAKAERAARIAPYDANTRELAATIAVQHKDFATARRHLTFLAALEPDRPIHTRRLEALERLETAR